MVKYFYYQWYYGKIFLCDFLVLLQSGLRIGVPFYRFLKGTTSMLPLIIKLVYNCVRSYLLPCFFCDPAEFIEIMLPLMFLFNPRPLPRPLAPPLLAPVVVRDRVLPPNCESLPPRPRPLPLPRPLGEVEFKLNVEV